MKFDLLSTGRCLTRKTTPPCSLLPHGVTTGDDDGGMIPCCEDPDFSASNPTVCGTNPSRLILKPVFLLKEPLQQVAYSAVLYANGEETELTSGVTFQSSNGAIAVIGVNSGKCSTLKAGICTISAQWGGLSAAGQLEVVADCGSKGTDFLVLIDNSKSMGLEFSSVYGSKLEFAKQQANDLLETIDFDRDRVAVYSFSSGATALQTITDSKAYGQSAIAGINPTNNRTNLKAALDACSSYLATVSSGRTKVIVLFSDGENKTGGNPLLAGSTFSGSGGILMVVGVRAWDGGFTLLDNLASGGFFINAYEDVQTDVADWLSGMKGYLCSGNCEPAGDTCVPYAELNYAEFTNWDVDGVVDLIGDGGRPLFDLLPGHGLYVDMRGSSAPYTGALTSKEEFDFSATPVTRAYRIRLKVAGNQRQDVGPWTLRVRIADIFDEVITVTDWKQDFTEYSFDSFTGVDRSRKIEILTEDVPAGALDPYGLLIDDVVLETSSSGDFDDTVEVFADDFDSENETCFPPNCGNNPMSYSGPIPYYGYCPASGCLDDAPIPAQVPDPEPLQDVEPCALTVPGTTDGDGEQSDLITLI